LSAGAALLSEPVPGPILWPPILLCGATAAIPVCGAAAMTSTSQSPIRILIILLARVGLADAAPLPQPKVGQSPSGYAQSGGFCAPMRSDAPAAVPKGS